MPIFISLNVHVQRLMLVRVYSKYTVIWERTLVTPINTVCRRMFAKRYCIVFLKVVRFSGYIYMCVVWRLDFSVLTVCFSVSNLRLTSLASNGSALYGKAPHLHPSSSLWLRRTPSCAASAGAWRQTCWACGGGIRHLDAESSGSSGGVMIPTLQSSSTTSFQVGSLTFSVSQLLILNSQHLA